MKDVAALLAQRCTGAVSSDAPLAPMTTFRVGGRADVFVEAESVEDLQAIADVVGADVPVAIIGRGSNLLVSDDGFHGVAVRLGRSFRQHERSGDALLFGAAVYMPVAAKIAAQQGLSGFEFAAEIPGSFGGAVRMNAGAHGREMGDVLIDCDLVDMRTGERRCAPRETLNYAYRHSSIGSGEVVVSGRVGLEPGDPETIARHNAAHIRWRRENQPAGRSCGSVFKNPDGDSAGRLIDLSGGKGRRSGGAEVSSVHANFIVAAPGASATDVWNLIKDIRALVMDNTGVQLELEVCLLGAFPAGQAQSST